MSEFLLFQMSQKGQQQTDSSEGIPFQNVKEVRECLCI